MQKVENKEEVLNYLKEKNISKNIYSPPLFFPCYVRLFTNEEGSNLIYSYWAKK